MTKNRFMLCLCAAACLVAACGSVTSEEETPVPDVPEGLILRTATETTLAIQWTAVADATGYDWRLLLDAVEVQKGSTSSRSVIIKDLTAGTDYLFSVRSTNGTGNSKYSSALAVSTTGGETPSVNPDPDPDPDLGKRYDEFLIPAAEEDGTARAFPGAEGGGMWVTGGRGGTVYHVTNLNDSGPGSLRYGLTQSGKRTIVFDVAGTIELRSNLVVNNGDVTIAGQTAPGDGICLKNYTFRIAASNVAVRFIRCRMGDEAKTEDDAIQVMSHDDDKYSGIIIDHCSVSWSTDECASFYGMKDFTFQWNIVSESLRISVHEKGTHGYGGIWGGNNATYHHNLLAHHDSRNPRLDHDYVSTQKGPLHLVNNVIYNWRGNSCYGGESSTKYGSSTPRQYNLVNNYYKPGPATPSNHIWFLEPTTSCSNCGGTIIPGHFYMDGNFMYGRSDLSSDNWSTSSVHAGESTISSIRENTPYEGNPLSVHEAEAAFSAVLDYAGASLVRDGIDARITGEARNGTATFKGSKGGLSGIIDTQTDVSDGTWESGWPVYAATAEQLDRTTDTDSDGIPNWFEDEFGLDKYSASDGPAFGLDPQSRYTNLEMYLHWLVKDIVAGGRTGSTYTKP